MKLKQFLLLLSIMTIISFTAIASNPPAPFMEFAIPLTNGWTVYDVIELIFC